MRQLVNLHNYFAENQFALVSETDVYLREKLNTDIESYRELQNKLDNDAEVDLNEEASNFKQNVAMFSFIDSDARTFEVAKTYLHGAYEFISYTHTVYQLSHDELRFNNAFFVNGSLSSATEEQIAVFFLLYNGYRKLSVYNEELSEIILSGAIEKAH